VLAALRALADEGAIPVSKVSEAIRKYDVNPDKANPQYA
jgi:pyruvate dehydrogenase E1 component